jgi:Cu+-exporting ATPase
MKVTDPVCDRQIDVAVAVACADHEGWAYFFCSAACHDRFLVAPGRYTSNPVRSGRNAEQIGPADRVA